MILIFESCATSFCVLLELGLYTVRLFLQLAELAGHFLNVDIFDVLAEFGQPGICHQSADLLVVRNGEDRLPEHQSQQYIMKPARDNEIRSIELREYVRDRSCGLIDNSCILISDSVFLNEFS